MKKTTLMWVGGATIAALAVGGVAYAMQKPKQAVPSSAPGGQLLPTTSFSTGKSYGFAAQIDSSIKTAADLVAALQSAGWSNVNVLFFGPTAGGVAPVNPPFAVPGPAASAYVASGTWNGAEGTSVPAGVVAVQIA